MYKMSLAAVLGLLLGLPVLGTNSWAVDLGEVYQGKIKCKAFDATGKTKIKRPLRIEINRSEEDENDLRMRFDFLTDSTANARLFEDAGSDRRAYAAGAYCANDQDAKSRNVVFNFIVKGQKLKGTASFTDNGSVGTCKWSVKEDSSQFASVDSCP